MGLDIHNPVFAISALSVIALVTVTLLYPALATELFLGMKTWVTSTFDWFFLISANFFILFCIAIATSRFGKIRLGGPDAKPQYNYGGWLAMLFAAGVGIGLMFFGVYEPLTHTLNSPLGIDPQNIAVAREAGMSATIFHWGLHAWAIYGLVGLALAFFCFNRQMPLTLRSAFFPLFGKAVWGPFGHFIDVMAVLATIFGLSTSLGFGAEQIAAGLHHLFDIPASNLSKILLIVVIMIMALISVIAGLDKGIKRLSELNMGMAAMLCLFVLVTGPTLLIFEQLWHTTINYLVYLPRFSNWIDRTDTAFYHGWTIFYLAWWISWSPFVGMFIARISYGRTIREFFAWVLLMPTIISIIWMSTLGGTGLDQYFNLGVKALAEMPPELSLYVMLEGLPFAGIVSAISVVLIAIFFVTSADSGSLVIDTMTAGGKMNAPVVQRIFWCTATGLVAIALLVGGGMASLQALTIAIGLPFCLVLLLMTVSLYKGLKEEPVP
ncbi:BCCT family transporter [Pseudomonadales bacterium]|nr:BCCT family transporter [Pseudomonadales bacterium]